jgi:hypothetical protein
MHFIVVSFILGQRLQGRVNDFERLLPGENFTHMIE